MKKLIIFIVIIILLFISFLIYYFIPKTYEMTYLVNNFNITEKYHKKEKYYSFTIKNNDFEFNFIKEMKYNSNRKVITKITDFKEEKNYCILPTIKNQETYPLCYKDTELVSFNLIENINKLYNITEKENKFNYENIQINYLNDQTYLLWNYKGFYFLNNQEQKEIKLFKDDIYDINLVAMIHNYLVIPDYDQEYKFSHVYIINMKNGKKEKWQLDFDIYFDSYVMGSFNKSIFIFDNKQKKQFELVPHKKKMRILSKNNLGKIYNNGWQSITIDKLTTKKHLFTIDNLYSYEGKDQLTYATNSATKQSTQISTLKNNKIIYQDNETLYYLNKDKLYYYNPYVGENLIMEYFEWNFNNENMIFIFDNQK